MGGGDVHRETSTGRMFPFNTAEKRRRAVGRQMRAAVWRTGHAHPRQID